MLEFELLFGTKERELLDSAPLIKFGWSELFGADRCP